MSDDRTHICPLCNMNAKLLKGNKKKRYFCINCDTEFTTNYEGDVKNVYKILMSGDLEEVILKKAKNKKS